MISIVGNIKIDEKDEVRVKYLIACIRSFSFLKGKTEILLNIEDMTAELAIRLGKVCEEIGIQLRLTKILQESYGRAYMILLGRAKYDMVLNFMEDHFCVCDDIDKFTGLLDAMRKWHVDVLKATFFQVEQNSANGGTINYFQKNEFGAAYWNMEYEHAEYCKFYGSRYYIGVNFITTKEFALKFWDRNMGNRPHEYEIPHYAIHWLHKAMTPSFEVLAAIDDDHGADNSCLIKRNEEKFKQIFN